MEDEGLFNLAFARLPLFGRRKIWLTILNWYQKLSFQEISFFIKFEHLCICKASLNKSNVVVTDLLSDIQTATSKSIKLVMRNHPK